MPERTTRRRIVYINREISWLEFNQRVLDQARRKELPLLERIKFLSITASNLDEFFQVRVGGLMLLQQTGKFTPDAAGLSPTSQLERIRTRANAMVQEQYDLMNKELMPLMQQAGISPLPLSSLSEAQYADLSEHFSSHIAPLLTPLAMEVERPPILPSLSIIIGIELRDNETKKTRFIAVTLPDSLPRRIHFASIGKNYVMAEDMVTTFIGSLFPGEKIVNSSPFRVTRNGDIAVAEEEGGNLAREMEEVLVARKFSDCVRLEIPQNANLEFAAHIASIVGADASSTYTVPGLLRLVDFGTMALESGNDHLKIKSWTPCWPASVDPSISMFDNIAQGDILIHNPFESYEPVVKLMEEAAVDPHVLVIKQVLYRTAPRSRFIAALCRAAENGKQVTALVELKARFDEGHNLAQAEKLQRAGVQVVYGVKGFKTHAKAALIVRKENDSLKRYCHFGTGNYNEKTANIYSDISLLTCNENLGADVSQFFNSVTGLTRLMQFRRIYPSPALMKAKLLSLITAETQRARRGERGEIMAKMNSLNDPDIIESLEQAAEAGVNIRLNVRGICCWSPGSAQAQSCTEIISIVDRYLEHARIFAFHNGGSPLVYISSADWMSRNLDRRVELMTPIEQPQLAKRLLDILKACFQDNTQAYAIRPDGTSQRIRQQGKRFAMQQHLQQQARMAAAGRERVSRQTLEPHKPQTH